MGCRLFWKGDKKMTLSLKIYTDETLTTVEKVASVDQLKIPYRAAMLIIGSMKNANLNNQDDLFTVFLDCVDELEPIIKATFGITDDELNRINVTELGAVAMELYKWGIDKVKNMKGSNQKNA